MKNKASALAIFLLFLLATAIGCGGNSKGDSGSAAQGDDSASDTDGDADTDADADADLDSGLDAGAGGPSECDKAEGAPAPCADDPDADLHPDASVDQVTKTVKPDFGAVPEGGEFTGDPSLNGPYGIYTEAIEVPIVDEVRDVDCMTISVKAGTLHGTAYLPKEGAAPLDGKFPLIVVLAGFQASYVYYATYSNQFASWGFAVMGIDTRSNATTASHDKEAVEVSQAITWAGTASESPFRSRIDMTKVAVAGHSKGGKVAFFTASIDNRVDIVIGWDPSNAGGAPCFIANALPGAECNVLPVAPNCAIGDPGILHFMNAESLVLGEPRDSTLNPDRQHNSIHFYRGAPSPAMLVMFDAGHLAPLGNATVIKLNKAVQMSLLLKRFKGMHGADLDLWLPDNPAGKANLESQKIVLRAESK